ncbi:MAG TPA: class I SAM-dependent methyltransferase [Pyrinomonadaceae bacterium]|jgi:2-polyprenyl-3-methyl-5-hydroxy-6-metoxy-1,4-benzoquinol methylase
MHLLENNEFDVSRLRDYYEGQGRAIRDAGGIISCSEKPTVDVVMQMATEYATEFQTVVDVGCGANLIYDELLAELGKHVVGIDFTFGFLKLAPSDSLTSLVQGDAANLPFCAETFDAAICSETVEHVPDDTAVINELARILRPGGWLFFTVPNLWNAARIIEMVKHLSVRVELMQGHLREYSYRQVSNLLRGKFEVQKIYAVGFGWSGSPFGGRVESLVQQGLLSRFSKSIAVAARKI